MNEGYDRYMLDILPIGIGYIRLLMDGQNESGDFIFLDVNAAFEELTGLCRKDILEKPASKIRKGTKYGGFDWISCFKSIFRTQGMPEARRSVEVSGRRLNIRVTPSDREIIVVVIQDAAGDIAAIHQRGGDELLGGETGKALHKRYEQCLSSGQNIVFEQAFSFNPGGRVWQTEVMRLFGRGGGRYLLCSSTDITGLKEERDKNEGLIRRLRSMFERHSAVMLVFDPVSGRITDANPAACDFYGYSRKEMESIAIIDINMLSLGELQDNCRKRILNNENYFTVVPHRLKSGEIRLVDVYSCPIIDGGNTFFYSIIFDATDRERYRSELFLEKKLLRTTLRSIGDGVVTTDKAGIITSLNSVAQEITGWDRDSATGRPFTDVFVLQNEETDESVENPVQKVLATGRIVGLVNHTVLLGRHGRFVPIADSAAPIKAEDGQTFGVVMVFRDISLEKEHSDHIALLDESGLRLSISLGCAAKGAAESDIRAVIREAEENMYHQKLLDGKSYRNAIISTLLATLYEKSMETEEHSKRVEVSCHLIGRQLQLSSKEMDELSLLAILHDIGKVGVSPNILKKPGALTPAEWEEMKRHPEIGYRIVQATPELANVADFILSHHERWDGKGYPRGLREKEIPLVCRILAVADAYDAMTNDRVYRNAKSSEDAIFELRKNAGTQFDPAIVSLFIEILHAQSEIKGHETLS